MRLKLLAFALSAGVLLSGCIRDEPLQGGVVDTTTSELPRALQPQVNLTDLAASGIDVPEWDVGHAWHIESHGWGDTTRCTLVVTNADASYTMSPTCDDIAQADAVFDISYIGTIRANDLAGAQQGTPVQFFSFPLTDGKTWTTTWDGLPITLTAKFVPTLAAGTAGSSPGFIIEGTTADGSPYVSYDYSPLLKWWTHLDFTAGYGIRVQKLDEGWKGTYKSSSAEQVYVNAAPSGVLLPGTFKVSEGQSSLVLLFAGGAAGYAYAIQLVDPDGGNQYQAVDSQPEGGVFEFVVLPPIPGEWKMASVGSYNPENGGGFTLDVFEVLLVESTL